MCERVEQLGGKITFDSPAGGGFNVTVTLPLPENKKEDSMTRILIADDHAIVRQGCRIERTGDMKVVAEVTTVSTP
jgi:hypothetical protein